MLGVINGWVPQNLKVNSDVRYEKDAQGNELLKGSTIIDFDDAPGALRYNMFTCAKRFTKDLSVQGIKNHYPGCGTSAIYTTSQSIFGLGGGLAGAPGDQMIGFIIAYGVDANGQPKWAESAMIEFTHGGEARYPQTPGATEYCTTAGGTYNPVTPAVTSGAPKKKK